MSFPAFREKQAEVQNSLKVLFPEADAYPPLIYDAMRYSLFSGGKRFRSVLALFCYELFKSDYKVAFPTACAIEYIHTYSLIHDDLPAIDNDKLRRGKPTCHVKFGEDVAILAGDALFSEAFYLISSRQEGDPKLVNRVIRELAYATGARGMVGGQVLDVKATGMNVDHKTMNYIHSHKTGKLISSSARVGAFLAEVSPSELDIVSEYAEHLGLAFQIRDDILDVVGSADVLGKAVGSDQEQKKATFPSVLGMEASLKKSIEARDQAIEVIKQLDKEVTNLVKLAEYVTDRES